MDHVLVRSENQDTVNEGMMACCNTSAPQPKKAYSSQTDSKNFLRAPVVAAVDGMFGFVDCVLASDRDLSADLSAEPLNFFRHQCLQQNIFVSFDSRRQLDGGDGDVFWV
jgi:hypothetical protein